jgi:hypothetical protein
MWLPPQHPCLQLTRTHAPVHTSHNTNTVRICSCTQYNFRADSKHTYKMQYVMCALESCTRPVNTPIENVSDVCIRTCVPTSAIHLAYPPLVLQVMCCSPSRCCLLTYAPRPLCPIPHCLPFDRPGVQQCCAGHQGRTKLRPLSSHPCSGNAALVARHAPLNSTRHHLPAGHLRVLKQLPPQQLEGQGQAPTDPQDGLLQALQAGIESPLQPGSPPEELASRALIQHCHLVLVQPLLHLRVGAAKGVDSDKAPACQPCSAAFRTTNPHLGALWPSKLLHSWFPLGHLCDTFGITA